MEVIVEIICPSDEQKICVSTVESWGNCLSEMVINHVVIGRVSLYYLSS